MSKLVLGIDCTDWADEYMLSKPDLSSEDAMVRAHQEEKFHIAQIGRFVIVARERGDAPDDIIAPNKMLLQLGTNRDVADKFRARKRRVTTESGQEIVVREMVAPVSELEARDSDGDDFALDLVTSKLDEGDAHIWVDCETAQALERAEKYLQRSVPGHIWPRLALIAVNGGDVAGAADELRDKINEMVEKLS